MLFGSHIFGNHGKPSNVNNFELHPTSTDKASTAPLEATRTLCPTAVFGARQESVAVPAAVCPKGADVTMYNDVHNTVNVCWIWRCWLGRVFCSLRKTEKWIEILWIVTHSVFFLSQNWTKTARKRIRLAEKTTRPRRGSQLGPLPPGTISKQTTWTWSPNEQMKQGGSGRIREAWNQKKPTKL